MIFPKNNLPTNEHFVRTLLDPLDCEVFIICTEQCEALFLNISAKNHCDSSELSASCCPALQCRALAGMCEHCPVKTSYEPAVPFELEINGSGCYRIKMEELRWIDGRSAVMVILHDITNEKNIEKQLYALAYRDSLTGLPNRIALREVFEKGSESGENYIALALFDLDNFKIINDTYGHNTGDILLRRLSEYLSLIPDFSGNLYRLGGDEFVLLFLAEKSQFPNEQDFRDSCSERLRSALYSYTIPIIDISCTVSIGVSYLPTHGLTLSELLRKSDIAMYRAKMEGRNQIVTFEDWYDTAKKFNEYYINVCPLLSGNGYTYGYELVDSNLDGDDQALNLNHMEVNRAIDALCPADFDRASCYFINYSTQLGNSLVQKGLPKDKLVVQVSESHFERDTRAIQAIREQGYRLLVSDLSNSNTSHEMLLLADYFKFHPEVSVQRRREIIETYPKKKFIATKIDTQDEYKNAKQIGYNLFQGQYFSQLIIIRKEKQIDPLRANYLRLLELTSTEDYVDFQQITQIISDDLALSYRLLRLLNSVEMGLRNRISSIATAVPYLGEKNLKRWIALLALRGVVAEKPLELVRTSLIRAKFGEFLAPMLRLPCDPKQVYFTGLLSLLHIALDLTLEELFQEITVDDDIKKSLSTKNGPCSHLIQLFQYYEYSNWDDVTQFANENGISSEFIYESYLYAIQWYNTLSDLKNI